MSWMSAGLNTVPTEWEIEFTNGIGSQLSRFVKNGTLNYATFDRTGEYIKDLGIP